MVRSKLRLAVLFLAAVAIVPATQAATDVADARSREMIPGAQDVNVKAQEYVDRGKKAYHSRDFNTAISNYTEALKLKPSDARLFFNRGLAYLKAEDLEHALADFSDCLAIAPGIYMALMNRANINVRKGHLAEALPDYDKAIELKADDFLIWYNRGVAHFLLGHQVNALQDFNEALRLNNYDSPSYSARADLYFEQGGMERAAADYRRVLVISPGTKHASDRLSVIEAKAPARSIGGITMPEELNRAEVAPEFISLAVKGCFVEGDTEEGLRAIAVASGWRSVGSDELTKQSSVAYTMTGGWTFDGATGPVAVSQSRESVALPVRVCSMTATLPSEIRFDDMQFALQSALKTEPADQSEHGDQIRSGYWVPHTTECTARVSLVFSRTERTLTIRMLHGRGGVAAAGRPNYPGNDGW